MPITDEEASKIKEHLLTQLDNFPEDKREQIKKQITSMTSQQVETFVEQNKLTHLDNKCIFCSIIANKTPSYKIAESPNGIAILELNPLSKGHALIIPKEHLKEIPESIKSLAQQVAKKLEEKFNPNEVQINELKIMDHSLMEVIPVYEGEQATEKKQATEEELKSLQKQITTDDEEKEEETEEDEEDEEDEDIPILPPRIP